MLKYIIGHSFLDNQYDNHKKLQCVTISYANHNFTAEVFFNLEQRKCLVRLISHNSYPRIVKDIELH